MTTEYTIVMQDTTDGERVAWVLVRARGNLVAAYPHDSAGQAVEAIMGDMRHGELSERMDCKNIFRHDAHTSPESFPWQDVTAWERGREHLGEFPQLHWSEAIA